MFLSLAPLTAWARALGAMASVSASMAGHAMVGHAHADISRAALAFVLLLGTVWRTDDYRRMLLGSVLAQLLVHGGVPAQSHMLALHVGAAICAVLLTRHLESAWSVCVALLAPLRRALDLTLSPPLSLPKLVVRASHPHLHLRLVAFTAPGRGPPVLA